MWRVWVRCGYFNIYKKKLNIGAGGRWVDNLFEAADSGDVLAHPRITCVFVEILNRLCVLAPPTV